MVVESQRLLNYKPHFAGLFELYCVKPMAPRYEYKVSSTDSIGKGYLNLALPTFINLNSSLIQANLSVFQRSFLDALSSKVMKRLMNLKRLCDTVADNKSFELS